MEKMIRLNNPQYFHFLQRADALRLSRSLCDAVISVDNHTFHAHRLVLACASRTLARQMERDSPVQCPLELSVHTFRQVLDFTYTQVLEVSEQDLPLLLRAAQSLEMEALEEQCRKQLNSLQYKDDILDSTEQNEPATQSDIKVKDEALDSKAPSEEPNDCTVVENSVASDSVDNLYTAPKKFRLSPVPALSNRDSVITSNSSYFSPWAFPAHKWNSVDTLRQITHNYSTLMSAQRALNPSITCPLSVSTHVLPLLSSAFQRPAQASVMSYGHLHPLYSPHNYSGVPRAGGFIRQGLLKRKKTVSLTPQSCSYMDVAKADKGRECQHCSAHPQESVCRSCGKGMTPPRSRSHELERRMDKPYQCKHCSKRFSLKHQLDTHHRVHTGEKPFECRLCGQRSRDYSAMIKHLRTHGGAAPYQCTVCLEYCNSLVAMQRHIKSHALHEFPTDWSIGSTYMYRSHI